MKILLMDLSRNFGGANTRTLALLRIFSQNEIALVALKGSPVSKYAKKLNISCYEISSYKLDPRIFWRLRGLLDKENFTLVDSQNIQSKFWSFFAVLGKNIALVSTLNSWYLSEYKGNVKGYFYFYIEMLSQWRTQAFLTVSGDIALRLEQKGVSKEKIFQGCNALWPMKELSQKKKQFFLQQYSLPENAYIILSVGRLVEAKGYSYMLDALKDTPKNIYYLVAGSGHLSDHLKKQTEKNDLTERVIWLGEQNQESLQKLYGIADFFMMPSLTEGTPFALLEAAMSSLPIAASNVGGIPNIITSGESGILFESKNSKAIEKAILWMYENKEKAKEFAEKAHQNVMQEFSPEKMHKLNYTAYKYAENRIIERKNG